MSRALLIHVCIVIICLVARGADPRQASDVTRPDCIVVSPFLLCNRSLGHHFSTQQCARDGTSSFFEYTPNRCPINTTKVVSAHGTACQKGVGVSAESMPIRGGIVVFLHSWDHEALLAYMSKAKASGGWSDGWKTWDKYLLTDANADLAVLFVLQSYSPEQDEHSLKVLQNVTEVKPNVARNIRLLDRRGREHTYHMYRTKSSGRLVLITFLMYPEFSNSEILAHDAPGKRDLQWGRGNAVYSYANNWYVFGMMNLPIMDFFDNFFKVDLDIKFKKPMPDLMQMMEGRVMLHTKIVAEPGWVTTGIAAWLEQVFANESALCKRSTYVCKNMKGCKSYGLAFYGNMMAGSLSFWQSAEVSPIASSFKISFWQTQHKGVWEHRWGDQQWWKLMLNVFFTDTEQKELVVDMTHWRNHHFCHKCR